jgi:hypothetical protein
VAGATLLAVGSDAVKDLVRGRKAAAVTLLGAYDEFGPLTPKPSAA